MPSIPLSCTTCCFRDRGGDEIEETLRHAPEAGYSLMGLAGPVTWERGLMQWFDRAKFRAKLDELGLGLTEIWSAGVPTDSDEAVRQGAEHHGYIADACLDLDCPCMVVTGGPRNDDGGLQRTIEGLRMLADHIAGQSVRVCLEPHVGSQILYPDDYAAIFDGVASDQFGLTIDTGHFHTAGVDFTALIREYADRVWNVHLKDHLGPQSVAIGTGEIDLAGLIEVLGEIGYGGALALELEVTDPQNAVAYVREAREYLEELMKR